MACQQNPRRRTAGTAQVVTGTAARPMEPAIGQLLGHAPRGRYEVAVSDATGQPVVLRNEPLLEDGTPMPTRYWLVGKNARRAVGYLEARGGCREAEAAIDPAELARAHERYASERDAALPPGWDGPRPSGGVGGARRGVKCLHAHYAWYLAGGDDPVGRWVAEQLMSEVSSAGPVAAYAKDALAPGGAGGTRTR
ncbi:MAG: DUF501 domain-containing protein [Acidimicrobiales bacterium]